MRLVAIDDAADPQVAVYLGLRDHVTRQRREGPGGDMAESFIAEGNLVIERGLTAGYALKSVLVSAASQRPLPEVMPAEVSVFQASPPVLEAITGRPELRDPIACFVRPHLPEARALVQSSTRLAVLEGISNPNNLGVVMRNAAGLAIDAVLLDPTCGDPLYRRAIRASMGQVFALPHARIGKLPASLSLLSESDVSTIALTPGGDQTLDEALADGANSGKVALLLGAEGPGLTQPTIAAADHRARIAMSAGVESLNVAAAAAIAFHALAEVERV